VKVGYGKIKYKTLTGFAQQLFAPGMMRIFLKPAALQDGGNFSNLQ
jgi:hypothetical protein